MLNTSHDLRGPGVLIGRLRLPVVVRVFHAGRLPVCFGGLLGIMGLLGIIVGMFGFSFNHLSLSLLSEDLSGGF